VNTIVGIGIRVSAIGFTLIVLVTITLLVAGYGLPVGIGALVGFVLGALAGLVGLLWMARGSGRTIGVGGLQWNSLSSRSEDPDLDRMRIMQELTEVLSVDLGRVRRIVPVLRTAVAGGLTVQLIDLEVHEGGLTLNFDVEVGIGSPHPPHMARMSVADDAATPYRASVQGNGSAPSRLRLLGVAIPAIPSGARRLTFRLEEFLDVFPPGTDPLVGPWEFEIDLG
jgi:hypothetical protein